MHKRIDQEYFPKERTNLTKICNDNDTQPTKSGLNHTDNESGDEASCGSGSVASVSFHADLRIRSQRARNISEKKRRDQLNMYIDQLAALLPQDGNQKMDKSSVLNHCVNYLKRRNKTATSSNEKFGSSQCFFSATDLGLLMQELLNGCITTLDRNGKITYISDMLKNLLGFEHNVLGQPIETLVHPEDVKNVLNQIKSHSDTNCDVFLPNSDESRSKNVVEFSFRSLRKNDEVDDLELNCSGCWSTKPSQEVNVETEKYLNMLIWPKMNINFKDKNRTMPPASFSTQLGIDGKFLLIDASCTQVIGYLPHELLNTSLYFYLHDSDLEDVVKLYKTLMNSSDSSPVMSFFRFRLKTDEWILLKAILKVTYNPMTEKPEYVHSHFALARQDETLQYNKLKSALAKPSRGLSTLSINMFERSESQPSKEIHMQPEGNVPPWKTQSVKSIGVSSHNLETKTNSRSTEDYETSETSETSDTLKSVRRKKLLSMTKCIRFFLQF